MKSLVDKTQSSSTNQSFGKRGYSETMDFDVLLLHNASLHNKWNQVSAPNEPKATEDKQLSKEN